MPTESQQQHGALALEFKTSTFSAPVLVLSTNNLASIEHQLQQKVEKAPDFFKNSPVVLDLQGLNKKNMGVELTQLYAIVRGLGLLPIGIRGGTEVQNATALTLAIPNYSIHHPVTADTQKPKRTEPALPHRPVSSTMMHNQPIRSGQRIYSEGDLIVLAPVNAGAEVIAEGNIHIYSTLRGKAFAGVPNNAEARIFCSDLQAELISIAGNYQVNDKHAPSKIKGKPVQIYLQEHTLIIKDI